MRLKQVCPLVYRATHGLQNVSINLFANPCIKIDNRVTVANQILRARFEQPLYRQAWNCNGGNPLLQKENYIYSCMLVVINKTGVQILVKMNKKKSQMNTKISTVEEILDEYQNLNNHKEGLLLQLSTKLGFKSGDNELE